MTTAHQPARDVVQEAVHIARGHTHTHRTARQRLLGLITLTLLFDALTSVIAYFVERDEPNTDIDSYGTALFWTTTQLLTVSSQMSNPVTTGGRVLDVFLELWGITVVATLAAILGAFLYRRGEERRELDQDRRRG
jgi:hypothetical protein